MIIELIRNWNILEQFLATIVIAWILAHIIKYIFKTSRPPESDLKTPGFPSAHTMTAFAGVVFLNGYMVVIGFLGAWLVGWSRLSKKHHSYFDCVGGMVLGVLLGGLARWLFMII